MTVDMNESSESSFYLQDGKNLLSPIPYIYIYIYKRKRYNPVSNLIKFKNFFERMIIGMNEKSRSSLLSSRLRKSFIPHPLYLYMYI